MMDRRKFIKAAGCSALAAAGAGSKGLLAGKTNNRPVDNRSPSYRRSIVWIMFDDGRADMLGCYGNAGSRTPNMDRLAQNGVRFTTAVVQNPVCIPSRLSMKTGFYAHQVGPLEMGKPAAIAPPYYDPKRQAEIIKRPNLLDAWTAAGIRPMNFGKIHSCNPSWKSLGDFADVVDVCGNPTGYAKQNCPDITSRMLSCVRTATHGWMIGGELDIDPSLTSTIRMGDAAVKTLGELAAKPDPFFLRVSFHVPHVPCFVPKGYLVDPATIDLPVAIEADLADRPRFERDNLRTYSGGLDLTRKQIDLARGSYYGMVSLVDEQIGRLTDVLQKTGRLDDTIIAINSDQGFQLGEHGLWKKRVFYDQNVCVPMVFHCPGAWPRAKVIDEPVEMIDFLPTLMDLCGLDVPKDIRGRTLVPLIDGRTRSGRDACFCEIDHSQSMYDELRSHSGRRVMIRTKEWKLIRFMDNRVADPDGALYHLADDPGETKNLYNDSKYRSVVQTLNDRLTAWDRDRG